MADKGTKQASGEKSNKPATSKSRDGNLPEEERGVGRSSSPASSKSAAAKEIMGASRDKHLPAEESGAGQSSAPTAAKSMPAAAAPEPVESKPKTLAVHTVKSGDTLSHMALQYYGEATREKWMQIYEANKEQLGPYPGLIRPGDKLIIPELESN